MDWGGANSRFLGLVSVGAAQSLDQTALRPPVIKKAVTLTLNTPHIQGTKQALATRKMRV